MIFLLLILTFPLENKGQVLGKGCSSLLLAQQCFTKDLDNLKM